MVYIIRFSNALTVSISWKKEPGSRCFSPSLRVILSAILTSLLIHFWKNAGCPGFPDAYVCRRFQVEAFVRVVSRINRSSDNDFSRLINLTDFSFLMNVAQCNDTNLILLILVHSSTENFGNRMIIRNTWGSVMDNRYKLFFLLGATKNVTVQRLLDAELKSHQDLIQGNFVDAYRNLTYKHVMGLKWAKYFCPKTRYLLKTDDDVFINLPNMLKYLENKRSIYWTSKMIRCFADFEAVAKRSHRSKWRVSWSEYPFRKYPPFCEGFAILYSADVIPMLYSEAQKSKYYWIDDVFVTGFMAAAAGLTPKPFGNLLMAYEDCHNIINGHESVQNYLIGPANLIETVIIGLWKKANASS